MSQYLGRLQHHVPAWVESEAIYHIRIRAAGGFSPSLTESAIATDKSIKDIESHFARKEKGLTTV